MERTHAKLTTMEQYGVRGRLVHCHEALRAIAGLLSWVPRRQVSDACARWLRTDVTVRGQV